MGKEGKMRREGRRKDEEGGKMRREGRRKRERKGGDMDIYGAL